MLDIALSKQMPNTVKYPIKFGMEVHLNHKMFRIQIYAYLSMSMNIFNTNSILADLGRSELISGLVIVVISIIGHRATTWLAGKYGQ